MKVKDEGTFVFWVMWRGVLLSKFKLWFKECHIRQRFCWPKYGLDGQRVIDHMHIGFIQKGVGMHAGEIHFGVYCSELCMWLLRLGLWIWVQPKVNFWTVDSLSVWVKELFDLLWLTEVRGWWVRWVWRIGILRREHVLRGPLLGFNCCVLRMGLVVLGNGLGLG